ncbi:MBL fold metallo-hydrolase [Vibrio hippocampi]|uniref:Metallo-beta-lactamase domain-containing protein n=1 Tax=Vibrio hippocampi TaxID=654686 RepID=A0ABN8DMJ2_9VIBR|nr:MBL fold metallo-hydrolase [Vibrio hippocampi]CAH0530090.1 hypothetical protein VHP8226_03818 [Vibrio hippocampi]
MFASVSQSVKARIATTDTKPVRFVNSEVAYTPTIKDTITTLRSYLNLDKILHPQSPDIPVISLQASMIEQESRDCVYRLGHSTVLLKLDQKLIITDPVLSERASPLDWAGPKRYHPLPIKMDCLPQVDICLISHDHYDHLDKETIKRIHTKVAQFLVPLNVAQHLLEWGVPSNKIREYQWWQTEQIGTIKLVFTPTQHFSGRSYQQRDTSLWGSWVIQSEHRSVYFSGDSGYFSGFKDIGNQYGPFDLTLMETGAYDENWASIHMFPEQSVQAHLDVQGKVMLPIHNCTFDLSYHVWNEPLIRAEKAAAQNHVPFICPKMGEKVLFETLADGMEHDSGWWNEED